MDPKYKNRPLKNTAEACALLIEMFGGTDWKRVRKTSGILGAVTRTFRCASDGMVVDVITCRDQLTDVTAASLTAPTLSPATVPSKGTKSVRRLLRNVADRISRAGDYGRVWYLPEQGHVWVAIGQSHNQNYTPTSEIQRAFQTVPSILEVTVLSEYGPEGDNWEDLGEFGFPDYAKASPYTAIEQEYQRHNGWYILPVPEAAGFCFCMSDRSSEFCTDPKLMAEGESAITRFASEYGFTFTVHENRMYQISYVGKTDRRVRRFLKEAGFLLGTFPVASVAADF